VKGIKRSCRYYDWGYTSPAIYGAFCFLKQKQLGDICLNCKKYKKGDIRNWNGYQDLLHKHQKNNGK
jgi:hypothetical protein